MQVTRALESATSTTAAQKHGIKRSQAQGSRRCLSRTCQEHVDTTTRRLKADPQSAPEVMTLLTHGHRGYRSGGGSPGGGCCMPKMQESENYVRWSQKDLQNGVVGEDLGANSQGEPVHGERDVFTTQPLLSL